MINAMSNASVPQISILIGASFGAANFAMCGRGYRCAPLAPLRHALDTTPIEQSAFHFLVAECKVCGHGPRPAGVCALTPAGRSALRCCHCRYSVGRHGAAPAGVRQEARWDGCLRLHFLAGNR